MASNYDPHYYSSNNYPNFSTEAPAIAMCCKETFPFFDEGVLNLLQLDSHHIMPSSSSSSSSSSSISMASSFQKQYGVPDFATLSIQDIGSCEYAWSTTHAAAAKCQPEMSDFAEECNGLVSNFWPAAHPMSAENWGIQAKSGQKVEESTARVGKYSVEERKERILKYLKKRNQRNFNKTIKYACRKTLADRRVRVRGRFAKNSETYEDETIMKANDSPCEAKDLYFDGSLQINREDEEWLQEAIASLMYVPCVD